MIWERVRLVFYAKDLLPQVTALSWCLYRLINNLEETDRKDLMLRKKGEAKNLRTQENTA